MRSCHGGKQVRRESRNAALARQVVADKRDLPNFGTFFHEAVFHSSRTALLWHQSARQSQVCRLKVKWEEAFSSSVDSVLRTVVFNAWWVYRSDAGWQEREKDIRAVPSYPSAWLHTCRARLPFHPAKS